jgi:hypothetical protein
MSVPGPRRLLPPAVVTALLVTAACDAPDTPPVPDTLPAPASSAAAATPGPSAAGALWTGLAGRCPELTGPAAAAVNATGEGRPTENHRVDGPLTTADCAWGSTDGQGIAVALRMTIYPAQPAADAAWQVLSAGQADRLPGVGDEAFTAVEPPAVAVRARSRNAVATVRLIVPSGEATPGRLRQLRPSAGEIAADVLDDLR